MLIEPPSSRVRFDVAERGELIVPCPLVSRGRPTFSSAAVAGSAPPEARWVAVQAGVGPAKLLVSWAAGGRRSSSGGAAGPVEYVIETSASSTNGRDGEWRHELRVTQNAESTRAHVVEFDGQSWVRLASEADAVDTLSFARLDLHDVSDGTDDCWLLLGEPSLAGAPLAGTGEGSWGERIHRSYPGYFPALIDETRIGESPARTLERLDRLLETHSVARRVALAYGSASLRSRADAGADLALDALVAAVVDRGRLPVLARPPVAHGSARGVAALAERGIDALERRFGLVRGPDLAAWFAAHPEQLDGEGRPGRDGQGAIERLWAEALDVWYVPQ